MIDRIEPLHTSIARHGRDVPTQIAVICGERRVTHGDLAEEIAAAASGLARLVSSAGRTVGVETDGAIGHLVGVVAAINAGLVPVPLSHDNPDANAEIIADAAPALIITTGGGREGEACGVPLAPLDRLVASGRAAPVSFDRVPSPGDVAMIYYTSGTSSGVRKGVVQRHRALEATARYITDVMQMTGEAVEFVASTADNAFWFGRCRVVLRAGGTVVLNDGVFNPLAILGQDRPPWLQRHRRRHAGLCDAAASPGKALRRGGRPPALDQGGQPGDGSRMARQAAGGGPQRPGDHELRPDRGHALLPFADARPHAPPPFGRPPLGGDRAAHRRRAAVPLPAGETGSIEVSGDNLAIGYLNKDAMWRERCPDGWYITGDLGMCDDEGYLTVKGRKDEAINVGGKTVAPAEVEHFLAQFVTAQPFVVCGAADPQGLLGEIPVLAVEGGWSASIPWPELRAQILQHVPGPYVPRLAVNLASLPRTSNGKVQRGVLRAMIEDGRVEIL